MADMSEDEVLQALREAGAIQSGHFILTSGRHSDTYIECARVLEDPELTMRLAGASAERVKDLKPDIVAAPAVGALVLGFATAYSLGLHFIFTERQEGRMTFRRCFRVEPGQRVLITEDVVTTGGSVAEVAELVTAAGGVPVGVASLVDRGGDKAFDLPHFPLLRLEVKSWDADGCALCHAHMPLYSPGSRRLGS